MSDDDVENRDKDYPTILFLTLYLFKSSLKGYIFLNFFMIERCLLISNVQLLSHATSSIDDKGCCIVMFSAQNPL